MTRHEFEIYRNKLMERFIWIQSKDELKFLKDKGYRYLFRCTHFKTGRYFWVFDKTESIVKDLADFKAEKLEGKEVKESIAIKG